MIEISTIFIILFIFRCFKPHLLEDSQCGVEVEGPEAVSHVVGIHGVIAFEIVDREGELHLCWKQITFRSNNFDCFVEQHLFGTNYLLAQRTKDISHNLKKQCMN